MDEQLLSLWEQDAENSYRYLLVDPLCPLHPSDPLHLENLTERFSSQKVVPVLRRDLSYNVKYCPHLVELASPGQSCDGELLKESFTRAYHERFGRKRVVCGWISDWREINDVAQHIASLCTLMGNEIRLNYVLPFFDPLRFELLTQANEISNIWLSAQLSPIVSWSTVDSGGELLTRFGISLTDDDAYLSQKAKFAQKNLKQTVALLLAWRRLELADGEAFPKDAMQRVSEQIWAAAECGITNERDIYLFGLNALREKTPLSVATKAESKTTAYFTKEMTDFYR